jgi:glucosamine 6-phosphate synthetase-like amidotransferase/phosphosugar isomerase protein
MCGIFGSTNLSTYQKLLDMNRLRGTFSTGSLFYSANKYRVKRREGDDNIVKAIDTQNTELDYSMFLGHLQAPTGSSRSWSDDNTHPFEVGDWIVAHNGVLENDTKLKYEHTLIYDNPVDTYVIPMLLESMYVGDTIRCIRESFSLIKGTFACWLYNKRINKTYVVRSGSTLFYNDIVPSISSIKTRNVCTEVDEGIIYEMSIDEGMVPVGEFKTHSPFLIL